MYQVDNTKRYNLKVLQDARWVTDVKNVELVVVEPGFVVVRAEDGTEGIYTGDIGIYITEV